MKGQISSYSKSLLIICGLLLLITIFVPIWRIELYAPQYPEGLLMQIYSNKLGGQVDIINGLNHYIGMAKLENANFPEFSYLPFIIGALGLLLLISAWRGSKKMLHFSFIILFLFGILAMIDFWRWEYQYGHNLDPNAAIIVPGMAYQPPLIGFKQMLNFSAYSLPDIGAWLMIVCGILLLFSILYENLFLKKIKSSKINLTAGYPLCLLLFISCSAPKAEPIQLNKDNCIYCKMTISDASFCGELVTSKGRNYKFDDMTCLVNFMKENKEMPFQLFLINDFNKINTLIDATKAFYIKHESINSPMRGNYAAFATNEAAQKFSNQYKTPILTWQDIIR